MENIKDIEKNLSVETPIIPDEIKMLNYKDRIYIEYNELKTKYNKLHRMIVKYEAGTLKSIPNCPIDLLKRQAKAMGEYLYVLELRAEIEDIILFEDEF